MKTRWIRGLVPVLLAILGLLAVPLMAEEVDWSPNDVANLLSEPDPQPVPLPPWGGGEEGPEVLIEPQGQTMRMLSFSTAEIINGGFESASLTGWGVYHAGWPGEWTVYDQRAAMDINPPPQGVWATTTQQLGPGVQILYQDIALPEEGGYLLKMSLYYHNWPGVFGSPESFDYSLEVNQQYRVDIMSPFAALDSVASGDILTTIFQTKEGGPAIMGTTPFEVDLSPYAGQTVRLRLACVQTVGLFYASVDDVRLVPRIPTGVTPAETTGDPVVPGMELKVLKRVSTPPQVPKLDLYFLADTTGSMAAGLAKVKQNVLSILSRVAGQSRDPRFGAGKYRDFPYDKFSYSNDANLGDQVAVMSAIKTWKAEGGFDGPESQLFALDQLASGAVAWRPDAAKFVVWFGDWPGHDPVCAAISGLGYDISEQSATAKLIAAGIRVIAISVGSGTGLDGEPNLSAYDYRSCGLPTGVSGQATRIAAATGGAHLVAATSDQIAEVVLAGIENLPVSVTPQFAADCSSELAYSITPSSRTVPSGEVADFEELITVGVEATAGLKTCTVDWLLDGTPAGPEFVETIAINVHRPLADPGGPYETDEGSVVVLDGSGSSDPVAEHVIVSYAWDLNGDGIFEREGMNVSASYADNGIYPVVLKVIDSAGATQSAMTFVTVRNVSPQVGAVTVSQYVVPVNTSFTVGASFSDVGTLDTHTTACSFGDGGDPHPGEVTERSGSGLAQVSSADVVHVDYALPGVYTVTMLLTDDDGGTGANAATVVAYDPSAGFVSGGGWIVSPIGAYAGNPSLTGLASFGFVSRYQKGITRPSGQTEFRFQAGDLNFHSDSYEWLVVNQSGTNAQFKGVGTLNGSGSYPFMLWAGDGVKDTFRIRIWTESAEEVEIPLYDNGVLQAVAGGSILIHTKVK